MALTFQTEVSDGVRTTYPVSFDFLSQAYVYVYVGDHSGYQVQVSYIWASSTTIEVTNLAELPAGTEFFIRRVVPRDDLIYTFADKSIRGALVDAENTHILHLVQEFIDGFVSLGELQSFFTNIDMNNNRITNLADAINPQDAVNLRTVETLAAVAKGASFVQEEVPIIGLFQGARWYIPSIPTTYTYYIDTSGRGQWVEENSVGDDASSVNISRPAGGSVEDSLGNVEDSLGSVTEDVNLISDYVDTLKTFEVLDMNYDNPFRFEADYDFSSGTVWGFAHTGQSLAEGGVGNDSVAGITPPVYPEKALMLFNAPVGLAAANLGNALVALQEPSRVTIATSFTRKTILDQVPNFQAIFHGQAWGGKAYSDLKKGGSTGTFEKIIVQANNAFDLRTNMVYKGVTCIHGEQDGLNGNTNYAANLLEWQTDFNTDLKAVTGQAEDIPLYLCQTATAGGYNNNGGITETTFPTPLEQLKAHVNNANITMVCSKYHLPYYDHSHITNNAQRILGEYYQKAFAEVQSNGSYEPLRPATVVGSGNTVTVTFAGRVGNLVFDTSLVQSAPNMGFDYVDDSGNTITDVAISANQIIITLSGTVGTNPFLSYAYHNGAGGTANQVAGLGDRGNLRDSDPAVSLYDGARLYNWCVIFKEAVS